MNNKLDKIYKWFRVIYLLLGPSYTFGVVLNKGVFDFGLELYQALILGFFLALTVFGILLLVDLGLLAWGKSTTLLIEWLKKYPKIRRIGTIPFVIGLTLAAIMISVFYWPWDNLSRFIFFIYFGVFLPAAWLSILRDEKLLEEGHLVKQITPELIASNPQAAIEHAFTLFEDHLRKRLNVGPEIYGDSLINLAFGQNARLIYSDIENENKGVRNLVSGAYATFRNPRKHRIIEDDEQTIFAIMKLIDLLFKIVDESKDNGNQSSKLK